jgi:hypothetical protein
MKCEECLPRIEEYVDGELDGRTMERISAHLTTCSECAQEFAELKREQEIYAQYRRPVEVTSAQWNIVRARIEQEKDAHAPKPRTHLRGWFKEALGSKRGFRTSFAAALVLIVLGITAGVIYLNSRHPQTVVALHPVKPSETPTKKAADETAPPDNEHKETVAQGRNREMDNSNRQSPTGIKNIIATKGQRKDAALAGLPHRKSPRVEQPFPDEDARLVEAVAEGNNMITGVRRSAPEGTGNFDFEIARHAEKAELLLRSFRNVRLSASNRALDVSYEKAQSRKLLYQNIALRRDAAARGDQPAAEVLNTLEPILLDIANLPNRAKPRDVRSIEQRMEKKEIVATLQVRTLVASN